MKKYEIMKGYTSKYQMIVYPKGRVRLENQIELTELAVGGSEDDKNRSIQYTKQGELVLTYYAPDYRDNNTKQLFFTQVVVYETTKEILKNENQPMNENIMEIMYMIGKNRGAILAGGRIDEEKTANILLNDFKTAKLGKISLEKP